MQGVPQGAPFMFIQRKKAEVGLGKVSTMERVAGPSHTALLLTVRL